MEAKEPGEGAPLLLHAVACGATSPSHSDSMAGKPSEAAPLLIQVCTACGAASSPAQSGAPGVDLSARTETAGGSSQPPAGTPAALGTPWGITTALLLADMFGIGSLALPGVFARLGWLVRPGAPLFCVAGLAVSHELML